MRIWYTSSIRSPHSTASALDLHVGKIKHILCEPQYSNCLSLEKYVNLLQAFHEHMSQKVLSFELF